MLLNDLQHVGIPTDKFDESRAFYEKLGFNLIKSRWILSVGGFYTRNWGAKVESFYENIQ